MSGQRGLSLGFKKRAFRPCRAEAILILLRYRRSCWRGDVHVVFVLLQDERAGRSEPTCVPIEYRTDGRQQCITLSSQRSSLYDILISGENAAFWFMTATSLWKSDSSVRSSGMPCEDPEAPAARRRCPVEIP